MLFKIQHWPFSYNLIGTGISLIGFVFIPLYAFNKYNEHSNKLFKAAIAVGSISAILISVGALLNLSDYQFGYLFYRIGMFLLVGIFIPLLVFLIKQNKENRFKRISILAFSTIFTLLFFLFPSIIRLRENAQIIDSFEIVNTGMEELNAKLQAQVNYHDLLVNHDDKKILLSLKERSDSLCTIINSLKLNLIESSKGNVSMPDQILFQEGNALHLENSIISHRIFINESFSSLDKKIIDEYLSTNVSNPKHADSWGEDNFKHLPLPAIVTILTILESDIRNVERIIIDSYNE
jgi:hypothetical protein